MDMNLDLIGIATILLPIAGMFLWNRTEANADRRDTYNKIDAMQHKIEASLKEKFETLDKKFEKIDQRFEKMEKRFNRHFREINADLTNIDRRLCRIEGSMGHGRPYPSSLA